MLACLVANPAAGRGRGARLLPAVREALAARGVTDVRLTQLPRDERRLAREAALAGVETIIALGGDGTWGNAARGLLEAGGRSRLALLVAGTGNDFSHALRLPDRDMAAMIGIALGACERRVDIGSADAIPFLNVAGIGIETSVIESTRSVPLLRGHLLYFVTALPKLVTYRAPSAVVAVDDSFPEPAHKYLALIAANGPRFGGGFHIAPAASLTDGLLDFVSIKDAVALRRAALLTRVRFGRHLAEPEVKLQLAQKVSTQFDAPPLIDVDGEIVQARTSTVEIRCLPQALRMAAP
jgi:diacylglycerol kinase (ATP)